MPDKLLILFTGTHSTGKTTTFQMLRASLLGALGENAPGVTFITGSSRLLLADKRVGHIDVAAAPDDQIMLTANMMSKFSNIDTAYDKIIVAERSPIDMLAYSRNLKITSSKSTQLNEQFLYSTVHNIFHKVIFVYFPPEIPYVSDDVRVKDSRDTIDCEILSIIKEHSLHILSLSGITGMSERLSVISDLIVKEAINMKK